LNNIAVIISMRLKKVGHVVQISGIEGSAGKSEGKKSLGEKQE
jgi:hypothetical protein